MSSNRRAIFLFAALLGSVWSQAQAQELPQDIDITLFFPAASPGALFALDTSAVTPALSFGAGATLGFALDPLKTDTAGQEASLITNLTQLHLYGALGLGSGLEIAALMPLTGVFTQDLTSLGGISSLEGAKPGDLRLRGKASLARAEEGSVGLAILAEFVLPTGAGASALGVPKPEFTPTMVIDYLSGPLRLVANIGYTLRSEVAVGSATIDDRINVGGGLAYALSSTKNSRLSAVLEAQANLPNNIGAGSIESETPVEARLGGRYLINSLILQAGVGRGLTQGLGAPSFRFFAGVSFAPNKVDSDKDGIRDIEDTCHKEPEDKDGFEDTDGCPDVDNDGDAILDVSDGCPGDKEDVDTFEDTDGCPDVDNDNDAVLDPSDQCPTEPEDVDSFEDENGCPDLDNDGDGILDADDMCVNEKEIVNGHEDTDGCPDDAPQVEPRPETGQITIQEKIYFAFGKAKINEVSFEILDLIAEVLNENPDIKLIRIEGHTDGAESEKTSLQLSNSRAKAVADYLTKTGKVDASRLIAVGYGKGCPLAEGDDEEAKAKNRRVEFVILGEGDEPKGPCQAKSRD